MRTILISLMLVMFTRVAYGDAVIFSGNDVKALKQNLDLFGTSKLMGTATDPSSGGGLAAPLSSIAMNYVTGIGYIKTSAPNTGWSRIVDTAYAPGVYFSQGGNAFGAAGVLGTTDANRLDFITGGVVGMSMATTGAVTVTSASANALTVGPNGATNPTLQVDTSVASAVTGIKITSAAAAGGAKIESTSSAAAEDLLLSSKGAASSVKLQVSGSNRYVATNYAHTFTQGALTSATIARFLFTAAADSSLTAATEAPEVYFNLGVTRSHSTGALALQRDFRIAPTTHSFVGASTLTNAAGLAVDGAPLAGTNATITNSSAIYSAGSAVGAGVTNSYGLNIAANTGATNNYAAYFSGGNVGIGNAAPAASLDITGTQNITSASASSFTVGANGATNPVLQVDSSVASQATGIKITGAAAGGGATIASISSGANEEIALSSKGSSFARIQVGGSNRYSVNNQAHVFANGVSSTAGTVRFSYTGAADTGLTASTEAPEIYYDLGQTRQHATGALTLQRDFRIRPSTHSFVGASTLTDAAALSIDGPPNGGTNATITNSHAIYIPTSAMTNVTNSYGLSVNATTGATNNYAAQFMGGNVGIGTTAPANKLHQDSGTATASYHQFTANATTGQSSTDGTLIGIDASGNAIFNNQEAAYINFLSSNTQRARITALGSLVVGNNSSALATSATDGFLYVSSSAGAPTGVPTTQTGSVPVHVDATNNAMYMYTNSAWRSVAGSKVQGSRQTGTSMSVGTAITPALGSKTVAFVVGNGGAITITASPPITTTGMIVGQELRVCGTSNTNTVTYNNSVNLVLTGSATLGKDQCLNLMYAGTDGTNLSWIETGRSF